MLIFVLFSVIYCARTQYSLLYLVILTINLLSSELIRFITRSPRTKSVFFFYCKETQVQKKAQGLNLQWSYVFTEGILCLKLWFESDLYLCNITRSGWFSKRLSRNKVLNNHFLKSVPKQLYADVLQNRCSQKFRNIHRKTSVLESFFNKATNSFFYRKPAVAALVSLFDEVRAFLYETLFFN